MGALRRMFGPSKKEIWQQLSEKVGGRLVTRKWHGDKVEVEHGEWTLTLDTYTVMAGKTPITFTRMRAPYVNSGGFRFTVYRKSVFSGIAKALGMEDIEIGDQAFDDIFIVKSSHESRARMLLGAPRLRKLIAAQEGIHLSVKDDEGWFGAKFPDGVDELHFQVTGVIKEVARLELLFELFAETLDALCRIGAADERDPRVELR